MHWLRIVVFLAIPLMLAVAAPVLILWAWGNDLPLQPALLVGVVFIAVALIVHLTGQMLPAHEEDLHALWHELEQVRKLVANGGAHLTAANGSDSGEAPAQAPVQARPEPASSAPASSVPGGEMSQGAPRPRAAPAPAPDSAFDFTLYMEPVKDLAGGATILYRAQPALRAADGGFFLGRNAVFHARRHGATAPLQLSCLARCVDFLHQLREHGFSTPLVCPLDVLALGGAFHDERLETLLPTGELRQSLLLAVDFDDLREATHEARLQLMMLAQKVGGVVLDANDVSAATLSLPMPLPVRFLDAPASALALDARLSERNLLLRQLTLRGWRLIAHDIADEEMLARVRQIAQLGRGRHLGAPKRVKERPATAAAGREEAARGPEAPSAPALRVAARA